MTTNKTVKAHIRFITVTTAEAVDEINTQLKSAGLPFVTENDIISITDTDHDDDWFDDHVFTFEKIFTGDPDIIIPLLKTHLDDIEIKEEE